MSTRWVEVEVAGGKMLRINPARVRVLEPGQDTVGPFTTVYFDIDHRIVVREEIAQFTTRLSYADG